jgi:hypothetical protein
MVKYRGPATWGSCTTISIITCFFTLLPCGLWMLLCPLDEKRAYKLQGQLYDERGQNIGNVGSRRFRES